MAEEYGTLIKAKVELDTKEAEKDYGDLAKKLENLKIGFGEDNIESLKSELSLLEEALKLTEGGDYDINIGGDFLSKYKIENIIEGTKGAIAAIENTANGTLDFAEELEQAKTSAEEMQKVLCDSGGVDDNVENISDNSGNIKINFSSLGKELNKIVKQAFRFTLALVGVRGIYGSISKAVHTYLGQNELLQQQMNAAWYAVGSLLSPVIEWLVNLLGQAVQFINNIVKALGLAGINMKNFANNANKAKNSLLAIDEINNTGNNNSAAEQAKEWLENISLGNKLVDLSFSIGLTLKDIFSTDLNKENFLEKLGSVSGTVIGGLIGGALFGVPGTIIGSILGFGLSLLFMSKVFNHDGLVNGKEFAAGLGLAGTLIGTIIGFAMFGLPGAITMATIGIISTLAMTIKGKTDNLSDKDLATVLGLSGTLIGMLIGTALAGPIGAVVALVIGVGATLAISASVSDDSIDNLQEATNEVTEPVFTTMNENAEGSGVELINSYSSGIESTEETLKGALSTIEDDISGSFTDAEINAKNSLNNILGYIESFINNAVLGINKLIDSFNSLDEAILSEMGINSQIGKLSSVVIPRLATGTNYVPQDMMAVIHQGEAVVPKEFNPNAFYGTNTAEELNLLVSINAQLEELNRKETTIELDGENVAKTINNRIENIGYRNGQRVFAIAR